MNTVDLDHLYDHRSEPAARSVLEDLERERYGTSTVARLGYALSSMADAAADADADDADDADADADAAADDADADAAAADADADAADADADAAAAAADAADADADAAAAAADVLKAIHAISSALSQEPDMTPGLKILQIQVTNWRAITFVGWLRRVVGDEFELVPGARIITRRSDQPWSWNGIDDLASSGPGEKYVLSEPMRMPEELHRLGNIRRSKPADEAKWAKHCPRPEGWVDP